MKPSRNVKVYDSREAVIAGFWQCGTLQWDEFYRYMTVFVEITTAWKIFQYDREQQKHGELCSSSARIVQPGDYLLLSESNPVNIDLISTQPRIRNPTQFNAPESHYRTRGHLRDGTKCLITGEEFDTYTCLHVAHIFPRAHVDEWTRKGYPSRIIDAADTVDMGGSTKIDSLQNLITMRVDLYMSWVNYEFGVDPKNGYRITSFTKDTVAINGRCLQLDHIQDPTIRPLDDLLIDHFMQGLFKHVKGSGDEGWGSEDYEDAFGEGSSLSNPKVWGTAEGKDRFELLLADRLFEHRNSLGRN